MSRLNEWIALKITLGVSTMWAFYILVIYGLTPLLWPQHMNEILYWSNFIQLVFLPLLSVGGAVLAKRQEERDKSHHDAIEQRDQETHDKVMAELCELKQMHNEMHDLIKKVDKHAQ